MKATTTKTVVKLHEPSASVAGASAWGSLAAVVSNTGAVAVAACESIMLPGSVTGSVVAGISLSSASTTFSSPPSYLYY